MNSRLAGRAAAVCLGALPSLLAAAPAVTPVPATQPAANPTSALVITSPAASAFDRAQLLFSQRQYSAALTEFTTVARNYPNDSRREESLYRIAECFRLLDRPTDALAAYAFAVEAYPTGTFVPFIQVRRAELLIAAKKFQEATPLLEQVIATGDSATQAAARYSLALVQLETGAVDAGRKALEEFTAATPPSAYAAPAAQALALSYEKTGSLADALRTWQKLLTLGAGNAVQSMAAARGGFNALQLGNVKEAEFLFETSRRLDATGDWRKAANTGLIRLYFDQQRWTDLVELYNRERTALLDSARADVLFQVSHALFAQKNWIDAIASFDRFLKDFPSHNLAPTAAYERLIARADTDRDNINGDTASFLALYSASPFSPAVQRLRAQDFSRRGRYAEALPMWQALATNPPASLPLAEILIERARALDELKQPVPAADAYAAYLQKFPATPLALAARSRQAINLQAAGKIPDSITAWEQLRAAAPAGSPERQTALEQIALLQAQQKHMDEAVAAFASLLKEFPKTKLRALASFTIGEAAFTAKRWNEARPALLDARASDPRTYQIPATQRLNWLAYQLKDVPATSLYTREYEDAVKNDRTAPRVPVGIYFFLGSQFTARSQFGNAVDSLQKVTAHPDAGTLLSPAWWALAEAQREMKAWPQALASYEKFREITPAQANATAVLLAMAAANLGNKTLDQAESLVNQALIQEPEGPNNAKGRNLLGEIFLARQDYSGAAKAFSALSLLYDDPVITPAAMDKAAKSYALAGDATSATEWRNRLKQNIPLTKCRSRAGLKIHELRNLLAAFRSGMD